MADDRMAALELLRKAAGDDDLDSLREGLAMLTQLVWTPRCRPRSGRPTVSEPRSAA